MTYDKSLQDPRLSGLYMHGENSVCSRGVSRSLGEHKIGIVRTITMQCVLTPKSLGFEVSSNGTSLI